MFIQTVRFIIPLVLLQFLTGCQSDDNDNLKLEVELLKEEISELTKEMGEIQNEVKEIKDLAFNPPKKEPPTLPNQLNFSEGGTLPILGNKEAKIAIVEFSDFQCPYCKRFTDNAFKQIKENYIDNGKVQYIARDFPLSFHAKAKGAAIAAACSLKQNSYWTMREMLFNNAKDLGEELYQKAAIDLSLNIEEFNKCMEDQSIADKIEQDMTLGKSLGIRGTPTFLIGRVENDQLVEPQIVVGAQGYAVFESLLEGLSNSDKKE
ncbi:DsbA family protein [Vibrio diabolicus]|uniref:DsbA family protein n=1 Tax=Vibrio diabolicus TaxID=50719 RepID=UPI00215E1F36|nr:DsbA family protein [Vibrio diabolicus]MCS0401179.1 DsbA family protein [Vibrio diabolicus]